MNGPTSKRLRKARAERQEKEDTMSEVNWESMTLREKILHHVNYLNVVITITDHTTGEAMPVTVSPEYVTDQILATVWAENKPLAAEPKPEVQVTEYSLAEAIYTKEGVHPLGFSWSQAGDSWHQAFTERARWCLDSLDLREAIAEDWYQHHNPMPTAFSNATSAWWKVSHDFADRVLDRLGVER